VSADNYHLLIHLKSGKREACLVSMEFLSDDRSDTEKAVAALIDHAIGRRVLPTYPTFEDADEDVADDWTEYGQSVVTLPDDVTAALLHYEKEGQS